jgi:ribosome-associated protein
MSQLPIDARVTIPECDLSWTAARSSGPGGQHVNKSASKVELRFDIEACAVLGPAVKSRLRALARGRISADGQIRVVSQRSREQARNLDDARERLAELIREALVPPKPRRATKPTRASKRRRVQAKRQQSSKKQLRTAVFASE